MIAGGDVGLDRVGLMQGFGQQGGRDRGSVDLRTRQGKGRRRDHVQNRIGVFVGRTAIGRINIVDQTLVQRPCVDLTFPVINDCVAEPEDLGLLIGNARRQPCVLGRLQVLCRRGRDQGVDCLL